MTAKQIAELIIDEYYSRRSEGMSPDDAKATAIDQFERLAATLPLPTQQLAAFIASLFGALIGSGLNFDEARAVFQMALEQIDSQAEMFQAMEANLKEGRAAQN